MYGTLNTMGKPASLKSFSDWTDRIARGEVPQAPPRPEGVERNVVITQWDYGTETSYAHDEITTAIARLRASEDIRVAFVLPTGSRLGTSRINFRLLAREAQELPRQASIVTTEAGVRAIAVSAADPSEGDGATSLWADLREGPPLGKPEAAQ
jgi:hypothetical protein